MFEEVFGIPAHPLLIHATVVFVPLQILAAFAYAFVPFVRRYVAWLVIGLGVVAPLSALFAKLSGDAFQRRLIRNGAAGPELLTQIDEHSTFGLRTLYTSAALGVLMIMLVAVQVSRSRAAKPATDDATASPTGGPIIMAAVLTVTVVVVGVAVGYYVFKTGDLGARMVWSNM